MREVCLDLDSESATMVLGAALAEAMPNAALIFLYGQLGAGKTTLVRGALRASGVTGAVKSPTYTLVESYPLPDRAIHHFDLYRLADPEELEYLGIRDYLDDSSVCFIEWPERGVGVLPQPDLKLWIDWTATGRRLRFESVSVQGRQICDKAIEIFNKNFDKQ